MMAKTTLCPEAAARIVGALAGVEVSDVLMDSRTAADACGAAFTRDPDGTAGAIEAIRRHHASNTSVRLSETPAGANVAI